MSQVGPTGESDFKNGAHFNSQFARRTNQNHAQMEGDELANSKKTNISQSTSKVKCFGKGNNVLKKDSKIDADGRVIDDSDSH